MAMLMGGPDLAVRVEGTQARRMTVGSEDGVGGGGGGGGSGDSGADGGGDDGSEGRNANRCIDGFGASPQSGNWYRFQDSQSNGCRQSRSHAGRHQTVDSVLSDTGRALNRFTGDLCSLAYMGGKYQGSEPRWLNLYYARPECYYHYPSAKELRACLASHKIKAVLFVGDSILRSLYVAFLDLIDVAVDEEKVKQNHGAGPQLLKIDEVVVDFAEYWFPMHAKKIQGRLSRIYKTLDVGKGDTVVIIANMGIMHTLPGACNTGNGFMKGLGVFKDFVEKWAAENHMNTVTGPTIRGIAYGSPAVLGLRNPDVSMAKGAKMTQLLREMLADKAGAPSSKGTKSPFPFELLDMGPLSHARIDATGDGFHYGQSLRVMQAVGLANMICNGHGDFVAP